MARIFYVHWNKDEALETARRLRKGGHTVICHYSTEEGAGADAWRKLKASPPEAFVISLARLPSHGRRIAMVTQQSKSLRDLSILFLDGEPEKVKVAREQFPKARFLSSGDLEEHLRGL